MRSGSQDSNVKRGRGRPKLTWVEAIKADLEGWNIPVGYREKGYPKQDPKNDCLDFVKIETS